MNQRDYESLAYLALVLCIGVIVPLITGEALN
jgi:hypothetical protein